MCLWVDVCACACACVCVCVCVLVCVCLHVFMGVLCRSRYDMVCPIMSAWALHRAWPEAELKIVPDAGHNANGVFVCVCVCLCV